jgi:hypothetical protein
MRPIRRLVAVPAGTALLAAAVLATAAPAAADHSNPATKVATPTVPGTTAISQGSWQFLANFGPNPGTDLEFFRRGQAVYATSGTLGQGNVGHVGQRIIQLVDGTGKVAPQWVADHGSANCPASNPPGVTGLQHDVQVTPAPDAEILLDATDATSRCHDPAGGGLEIVDISGVGRDNAAAVKEIHLTRHDGTSHNVTVDATRPWIAYNSNTDQGRPWIDVLDLRTCLGLVGQSLDAKRAACRPLVYRMPFEPTWTAQQLPDGTLANPYGCHDITAKPGRLYCAAIFGTAVFDVTNITDAAGNVRGTPLPCKVINGTNTAAKVTDCDLGTLGASAGADMQAYNDLGRPAAEGWSLLAKINHPGTNTSGNNQTSVPADEGVSVSHEADPSPDGRYVFVTDERGGGLVPPGATCAPGPGNPIGNGGMHVFDLADPANPKYAKAPDGSKAVFISSNVLPEPTFCNIHLIEQVPDESRIFMAWYSQGIKVVDYSVDANGAWTFKEVGYLTLPGAQTWAAEFFKILDNPDGTRTYYAMLSDIGRGIDVISFTAKPNKLTAVSAGAGGGSTSNTAPAASTGGRDELPATSDTIPPLWPMLAIPAALLVRRLGTRGRAN